MPCFVDIRGSGGDALSKTEMEEEWIGQWEQSGWRKGLGGEEEGETVARIISSIKTINLKNKNKLII